MKPDADFRAQSGPLIFSGDRFDWTRGWYVVDVTGLNSGVSASPDEEARDGGEGQHDLPNLLTDARSIFLRGFAYAPTMLELGKMARQQGAHLALPEQRGAFSWVEFGEHLTVDVRRGPNWNFERQGSTGFAEFQVRLRAPSQVFYGVDPVTASGTAVEIENTGTVPSAPGITVTGDMPNGYTIQGPGGRQYQVTSGINPGNRDFIDFRTGLLRRDGISITGAWGQHVDVWSIPPGVHGLQLVPVTGAGQMKVELRPAYF